MKDQENISAIEQYVIDYVRDLRNRKNINQDGLGSILGVGKSFVSNVESLNHRAKYNLTHINALADYFNMKPGDFLPEKALAIEKRKKDSKTKLAVSLKKNTKLKNNPRGLGVTTKK